MRRLLADAGREKPKGWHAHHVCGNPRCINLDHIEVLSPRAHYEHHNPDAGCLPLSFPGVYAKAA